MSAEKRTKPAIIPVPKERASDSTRDAKELLRLIIAVSGGRLEGKTRLFKAFYAAHLFHYKEHGEKLSDYPIVHMPHGPGIDNAGILLRSLVDSGDLSWEVDRSGVYPEERFALLAPVDLDPGDSRFNSVSAAVQWVKSHSAADLSTETHEKSRSWRETTDGEEMNIYVDLLTDEEVERRTRLVLRAEGYVKAAFGS